MNYIKSNFFVFISVILSSFCFNEEIVSSLHSATDGLFLADTLHKASIFLDSLDAFKIAEFINNFERSTIQAKAHDRRNLELCSSKKVALEIANIILRTDAKYYEIEQSLTSDLYDKLIKEPNNKLPKSKL